jgi:16S rRNA processing protein RimM
VALPGQDLLAVDHLGREVLIPMVKAIITNIDIANKKIEINPPEGLLDVAL